MFDGVYLSINLISYQLPMCTILPSSSLGILIFTSNILVLGPVSINELEFASNNDAETERCPICEDYAKFFMRAYDECEAVSCKSYLYLRALAQIR